MVKQVPKMFILKCWKVFISLVVLSFVTCPLLTHGMSYDYIYDNEKEFFDKTDNKR